MMMNFVSGKRVGKSTRKVVISVLIFFNAVFFLFPQPAHAQYWGTVNIFSDLMINMMEGIQRSIEGALLGSLKVAAVQMLNTQVGQLVSGGVSGRPLFITDFNDFLYQGPAERADLYMNDFFTLTTRGQSARANYISVGDSGGIGGNYAAYLESVGRQVTTERGRINISDLNEYTPSPEAMFAEGDWRAFNAFFSNPANNPYGYALQAEEVYQNKLAREQRAAEIEAQSSGFLAAKQGGRVVTPAGSIEAALNNVQDLGNRIIAGADNPAEFLSGVVAGVANRMVSNLIQRGVGQVESTIRREVYTVGRQVDGALSRSVRELGPAAPFARETIQRSSINVNSVALPPPNPWKIDILR